MNEADEPEGNRSRTGLMLLKFAEHEHMVQLLEEGLLFMQRAERFCELDPDGGVRADPWEGI